MRKVDVPTPTTLLAEPHVAMRGRFGLDACVLRLKRAVLAIFTTRVKLDNSDSGLYTMPVKSVPEAVCCANSTRAMPTPEKMARLCLTLLACATISPLAQAQELTVSAAASLGDAFKEIGKAFEAAKPGTKVVLNFAASGPLLQQIAQGAPVDVFASADQETMDRAATQGLISRDSRITFASNLLVLVIPASAAATPRSLNDLTGETYRRIAIGNAASVPAGRYALEATDAAGLTGVLKPKFITGDTVRQVLTYVGRAEVDAGFVYRTDALIDKERVKIALELPTRTSVTYPVAQVSASKQPALAREFIAYLRAPPAQAVLTRYGFQKP